MDELEAAQQALIARRLSLGLDAEGKVPKIPSVGEVLTRAVTTIPLRSRDELIETCPACGIVIEPVEFELMGTKRLVPGRCPTCDVAAQEAEEARRVQQAIEKRLSLYRRAFPQDMGALSAATFDGFEIRTGSEQALGFAKRYADGLPDPKRKGLVLFGRPGNGKSHLIAAILQKAREKQLAVAWIHAPSWLRDIGTMDSTKREDLIRLAASADMLVMDELGGGKMTASRAEWLLSILDAVYRHKRLFTATSNLKPGGLVKALTPRPEDGSEPDFIDGERIVDRLMEVADFVENTASSYRVEIARKRLQEPADE